MSRKRKKTTTDSGSTTEKVQDQHSSMSDIPTSFDTAAKSADNTYRKSDNRRSSRKPHPKPASSVPKNDGLVIPADLGITVPKFQRYNASDEETHIPLGICFGHYTPAGQEANEFYPTVSEYYLASIRTSLKNAGYAQEFTNAQIRTYLTQVSTILQCYKFIYDLRSISVNLTTHTSPVLSTVTSQAINGRLVANQRNVNQLISQLPYPANWKDLYWNSLGVTLVSDNPNSGIRMFAPKEMQSGIGRSLEANDLVTALTNAVNAFYDNDTSVLLSTVLQAVMPTIGALDQFSTDPFTYNNDVINNILNLAYFDSTGPVYSPYYGDTDTVPLFFRRSLAWSGCLTFVPDNNLLTVPQATVWSQAYTLETAFARNVYDNDGLAVEAISDSNLWLAFGSVWEADITLNAGRQPSVTRVNATFEGVATGIASHMYCVT